MSPTLTRRFTALFPERGLALSLRVLCGLLCVAGWACDEPESSPDVYEPGGAQCEIDTHGSPEQARALTLGEGVSGQICPLGDEDWYWFEIPPGQNVLRIQLKMSSRLSPVSISYVLSERQPDSSPGAPVASTLGTQVGQEVDDVHCLSPGTYLLVVRDARNDAQDARHGYTLTLSTSAQSDPSEPNDSPAEAVPLGPSTEVVGAIACRGDQDWFKITVPERQLLQVLLTMPEANFEPTLRLLDEDLNQLFVESNRSAKIQATHIERFQVLPRAGTYYLVVSDFTDSQADPNERYVLRVLYSLDQDRNEPNNHPREATPLRESALSCGGEWTTHVVATGTIGAPGDLDWFSLPLSGCGSGIIEAEVVLDQEGLSNSEKWQLNAEVQLSLALIRPHRSTPCSSDASCTALNLPCTNGWDCAGVFNTCLTEGLCAGAAVCLPGDVCGANVVQRRFHCPVSEAECAPTQPAPPHVARVSAPLDGDDLIYVMVSDFQSNGSAPKNNYSLRVRVRQEPDANEPNNLYHHDPRADIPAQRQPATAIPVNDCTQGVCCAAGGTWVQGMLSYDGDIDWFSYPHPCPGQDCTLRLNYTTDAGPVDFVVSVHTGDAIWFSAFDVTERESQSAKSGALGGAEAGDSCFYAYQGHTATPTYNYRISVRDLLLFARDGMAMPTSRDWSVTQSYRLCLEKVANVCSEPPCKVYANGCGRP